MCFSAEVSFGASVVISTIGIISYKQAKEIPYRHLALIPIFFGIQQFLEGIVWLASMHENFAGLLNIGIYGFIFFAWIVWPVFGPFVMWNLERNPIRKLLLLVCFIAGIIAAGMLVFVMSYHGVYAQIEDCSIAYKTISNHPLHWLLTILYLMATVLPTLISSISRMWFLGLLNLFGYFISQVYFQDHLISIWCFIAALISVIILWIIIHENHKQRNPAMIH